MYIGLVAQWTRARGYEPRCQGFDSLLAQTTDFRERWQSWSIASDLKSDEVKASVGSNPTLSTIFKIFSLT